jgi:hypothetical protein
MVGDGQTDDSSTVVAKDDQHAQQPERDRRHDESGLVRGDPQLLYQRTPDVYRILFMVEGDVVQGLTSGTDGAGRAPRVNNQ